MDKNKNIKVIDNKENEKEDYGTGNKLFNCRRKAGITQQEAADFLGVSRQTLSKWETGKSVPDGVFLKGICELYHISPNELLGLEMEKTEEQSGKIKGAGVIGVVGNRRFKVSKLLLAADLLICVILTACDWKMFFWVFWVNFNALIIYVIFLIINCLRKYLNGR